MADNTIQYQDVVLNTLKSKTVIGTDSTGKIIDGVSGAGGLFLKLDQTTPQGITGAIHLGSPTTNGTWKIESSGGDLVFSKRESGSYVVKGSITA